MKNKTKRREERAYDYEHASSIKVGKKKGDKLSPFVYIHETFNSIRPNV